MRVGSSWHFEGEENGPGAVVSDILLRAPSAYEMTDLEGWHSISPIIEDKSSEMTTYRHSSGGALSLMVNGPLQSIEEAQPLSESQQKNLLDRFRYWYPYRFIDHIRRKDVFPSAINDFVDMWHAGETGVAELRDFFGFTQEEYSRWVEHPGGLTKLLTKKTMEYEDRLGTIEGFPLE
jgi:hypothetical protein